MLHTCHRINSSCARCRACDAARTHLPAGHPSRSLVVRVCAHCDGALAHRLATGRSR